MKVLRSRFTVAVMAFAMVGLALQYGAVTTSSATAAHKGLPSGPIKIGALFSLSGPDAAFGVNEQAIEKYLVSNLNHHGGIDGHQVKLIALNDQGNVTTAVSVAEELVSDKVVAVMYPGTTSTNLQTTPVFMKAKIPVITYDPTDTWANGHEWPYFFDTYPLNSQSWTSMVNYMKSQGITKVALLEDDTPFASTNVADFIASAAKAGIVVAASETYPATAVDVSTEVAPLIASGAQTLVLIAQVGVQTVYAALASAGWSPSIYGTAVGYFEGYSSLGPLAAKAYSNCGVSVASGANLPAAISSLVTAVGAATGGVQPDYASTVVNVNDDLLILKKAITAKKSLSGPTLATYIDTIKNESFTSSAYKYTFTKSDHAGYLESGVHTCLLSPLGQLMTPVIAPGG
jgi:ABC-type branched-subunit amino acid transport system substrate-binding protein